MNLTANESRQRDNKSNIVVEVQHFPDGKLDSNVTSQDHLFAFEKKEDAKTNAKKSDTFKQKTKVVL